jgi:hypothetical protein
MGDGAQFKQETSKFYAVPKNKELIDGWRDLPEKEIVWAHVGTTTAPHVPPVPPRDSSYKWMYEALGKVINAGEQLCMHADLANSIFETERIMRGGGEVECEVVACIDRGKVCWRGLRVAGLCVGVDEYDNTSHLQNAVRDAGDIHKKLKGAPRCHSILVPNSKTVSKGSLLRFIGDCLEEPDLHKDPPQIFKFYYAGHGIQQGDKVYLVPSQVMVTDDVFDDDCLPLDRLMKLFRDKLDDPVRRSLGPPEESCFSSSWTAVEIPSLGTLLVP